LQNCPEGSVLVGKISYGKLSFAKEGEQDPEKNPVAYQISYIVPPNKVADFTGCGFNSKFFFYF